jgi:hypothetical protein
VTHSTLPGPFRSFRRSTRDAAGLAAVILAMTLTGCGGPGDATPSSTATPSATPSASGSDTASPAPSAITTAPWDSRDLPSPDLETSAYEGVPRLLADVFHEACLTAVAGENVPTREDEDTEGITVWGVHSTVQVTEGWKACPTQVFESIYVPSAFEVREENGKLGFYDVAGTLVGGFQADASARAPGDAELVQAFEVTELEPMPFTDEVRYLRTLLVDVGGDPQLLIDQVSAPAGTDPESLEVWDLVAGDATDAPRHLVYATIDLDTLEQGKQAAASELANVLQSMVASYHPAVQ